VAPTAIRLGAYVDFENRVEALEERLELDQEFQKQAG
jgi:hypothetical protein